MNTRLTSLPEFTIRQLETSAEIEAFVRLTEIAPILNILFPTKQAWIAGSDYF